MLNRITTAGLAVFLCLFSGCAIADESQCSDHASVAEALHKTYGERMVAIGLTNDGAVMEIYAASSGTYSIVLTYPGRASCIVSAGVAYESVPAALSDPES